MLSRFSSQAQVSDTLAIFGIWDHNIGEYRGPYSKETKRNLRTCTANLDFGTKKHEWYGFWALIPYRQSKWTLWVCLQSQACETSECNKCCKDTCRVSGLHSRQSCQLQIITASVSLDPLRKMHMVFHKKRLQTVRASRDVFQTWTRTSTPAQFGQRP